MDVAGGRLSLWKGLIAGQLTKSNIATKPPVLFKVFEKDLSGGVIALIGSSAEGSAEWVFQSNKRQINFSPICLATVKHFKPHVPRRRPPRQDLPRMNVQSPCVIATEDGKWFANQAKPQGGRSFHLLFRS